MLAAALAASLLATLFPLATPGAAAAGVTTRPAFGVQFHATWSDYTDAQRIEFLDKMAAAGVKWVRIDIGWASLQETGPLTYSNWYVSLCERIIDAANARGIKVLGTLWTTPSWANGGIGKTAPPTNPADYAAAARWIAAKFAGRVDAWEVWNEPNHGSFFKGTAADYTQLLKAAYPAFKLGDPTADVVLGGPSYNDTEWLKKVYAAGAAGSFDIMSTHPYQGFADAPPETPDDGTIWTMDHVGAVYKLMQQNGDGDKPIWFTEFGWSSHANEPDPKNWMRGVTEEQQADYAVRTMEFLKRKHPYVTNIFWYTDRNRQSGNIQVDNYGLLYRDLKPKPVYDALKAYLTGGGAPAPTPTVTPTPTPTAVATATPTATPTSSPAASTTPSPSGPGPGLPLPSITPEIPLPSATASPTTGPVIPPVEEPAEPSPVTTPETPQIGTNLLPGGDFEGGTTGWAARGTLRLTDDAHAGTWAARVAGRQRHHVLRSPLLGTAGTGTVTADGWLKGTQTDQLFRVTVVESIDGEILHRESVHLRVSKQWKRFPDITIDRLAPDTSLQLKIVSLTRGTSGFKADDISLSD